MISSLAYPQETVWHSSELITTACHHVVQLAMCMKLTMVWAPSQGLLFICNTMIVCENNRAAQLSGWCAQADVASEEALL